MNQNAQCSKVAVKGLDLCLDTDGLNIPSTETIREMIREEGVAGGAGINYSLEEQWTGRFWVDGKKIYQKSVLFGVLPNRTTLSIAHDIENVDRFIDFHGTARDISSPRIHIVLPHVNHAHPISSNMSFHITDHNIIVACSTGNWSMYDAWVIMQYTCMDR